MTADDIVTMIETEDSADLFDGSLRIKLHGNRVPLADAAIAAAFLPADEREVIMRDIRQAVTDWHNNDIEWLAEDAE